MDSHIFGGISEGECFKRVAAVTFWLLYANKPKYKCSKTSTTSTEHSVLKLEQFCYVCIVPILSTPHSLNATWVSVILKHSPFERTKCMTHTPSQRNQAGLAWFVINKSTLAAGDHPFFLQVDYDFSKYFLLLSPSMICFSNFLGIEQMTKKVNLVVCCVVVFSCRPTSVLVCTRS